MLHGLSYLLIRSKTSPVGRFSARLVPRIVPQRCPLLCRPVQGILDGKREAQGRGGPVEPSSFPLLHFSTTSQTTQKDEEDLDTWTPHPYNYLEVFSSRHIKQSVYKLAHRPASSIYVPMWIRERD
jgi:hypothetical protein